MGMFSLVEKLKDLFQDHFTLLAVSEVQLHSPALSTTKLDCYSNEIIELYSFPAEYSGVLIIHIVWCALIALIGTGFE